MKTAVIITMFGKHELTDAVVSDLNSDSNRDKFDIIIVDNGATYPSDDVDVVLAQQENLGWLRGVNAGLRYAYLEGYDKMIFMDNDVRLSVDFISHLLLTGVLHKHAVIAPVYDDVWEQQVVEARPKACDYEPVVHFRRDVKHIDGTCQFITRTLYERLYESLECAWFDARYFSQHGWGADLDLAIRLKNNGIETIVTEAAYLNHLRGTTNRSIKDNYEGDAGAEMNGGMNDKYGTNWGELL